GGEHAAVAARGRSAGVSHIAGASSGFVRSGGGGEHSTDAGGAHARRAVDAEQEHRNRAVHVPVFFGAVSQAQRGGVGGEQRGGQLVSAADQCAGGNYSSHAALRDLS